MAASSDAPHLPRPAPIEAYGKGGFAFADMSHRGSLLCLPHGIWAWPVTGLTEIDEYSLDRVFKAANSIDTLIVGTGTDVWVPPRGLREALRAVGDLPSAPPLRRACRKSCPCTCIEATQARAETRRPTRAE